MSLINLPAIETDIGTIFHAASTRFRNAVDAFTGFVNSTAASPLGKLAIGVVAKMFPTESMAATASIAVLNSFDAAVDLTDHEINPPAAGTSVTIPVVVPADVLNGWLTAKKSLVQFESTV